MSERNAFRVHLSDDANFSEIKQEWIDEFHPELVYTQSYGFSAEDAPEPGGGYEYTPREYKRASKVLPRLSKTAGIERVVFIRETDSSPEWTKETYKVQNGDFVKIDEDTNQKYPERHR